MHVESTTALGRLRGLELSPARFLQIALASVVALWLIAITGAAVRLTDSGLGCRHWPGCERGHPLPAKDYHAYIEFGNRMFGGVVIVVALLAALGTILTRGLPPVKTGLRWPIVAAHLLLSMALLAGAVVLSLEAFALRSGRAEPVVPLELRRLGLVAAAACLALLVSGTLATAGGPHSGGGAEHVDRLWRLQPLVYAHATTVAVFGLAFVFLLGYLAARRERSPRLFVLGLAVLVLLLAQMAIGEAQYRTHLPWPLVLVHVGLAAGVWAALVAFVTVMWRPPGAFAPGRA